MNKRKTSGARAVWSFEPAAGLLNWVSFAPDAPVLVAHGEAAVAGFDVKARKERFRITTKLCREGHGSMLLPGGELLAVSHDNVALWDVRTGKRVRTLKGPRNEVRTMTCTPDGSALFAAVGTHVLHTDSAIYAWDVATGERTHRFKYPRPQIVGLSYVAPGTLVSVDFAQHAVWWKLSSGKKLREVTLEDPPPEEGWSLTCCDVVGLSLDGTRATTSTTGSPFVWDTVTGKRLCAPETGAVYTELSPDGRTFAAIGRIYGGEGLRAIEFWDVKSGELLARLPCAQPVGRPSFSRDGRWVAWIDGSAVHVHEWPADPAWAPEAKRASLTEVFALLDDAGRPEGSQERAQTNVLVTLESWASGDKGQVARWLWEAARAGRCELLASSREYWNSLAAPAGAYSCADLAHMLRALDSVWPHGKTPQGWDLWTGSDRRFFEALLARWVAPVADDPAAGSSLAPLWKELRAPWGLTLAFALAWCGVVPLDELPREAVVERAGWFAIQSRASDLAEARLLRPASVWIDALATAVEAHGYVGVPALLLVGEARGAEWVLEHCGPAQRGGEDLRALLGWLDARDCFESVTKRLRAPLASSTARAPAAQHEVLLLSYLRGCRARGVTPDPALATRLTEVLLSREGDRELNAAVLSDALATVKDALPAEWVERVVRASGVACWLLLPLAPTDAMVQHALAWLDRLPADFSASPHDPVYDLSASLMGLGPALRPPAQRLLEQRGFLKKDALLPDAFIVLREVLANARAEKPRELYELRSHVTPMLAQRAKSRKSSQTRPAAR